MSRGHFSALVILYFICAAAIVLFVGSRFTVNTVSDAPFETVSEAVLGSTDLTVMQEGNNQMIKRLYGFDPDEIGDVLLYYPLTNMGAEELLLVRMEDPDSSADTVTTGIEDRITSQENSFNGYAPEQYSMIEKSITDVQGNYILFISSSDPEKTDTAFRQAVGAGSSSGPDLTGRIRGLFSSLSGSSTDSSDQATQEGGNAE